MPHKRVLPRVALAAFAAAATALAGAGPAAAAIPADVADDIPNLSTPVLVERASTGTLPEGVVEAVVARGADDSVVISWRNPADDTYRPLFSVGGRILGDPAAVATNAGIEVFARGTDNRIYTNTVTREDRGVGYSVVPGLAATSDPEVVQLPGEAIGNLRLFVRGADGAVWSNIRRAGAWQGWTSLGGSITSEISVARPSFASFSTGFGNGITFTQIQLVARGTDKRVYRGVILNGANPIWQPVGGDFRAASNITFGTLAFNVSTSNSLFARGEDGRAVTINPVAGETRWTPIGGTRIRASDIAVSGNTVFLLGADLFLYTSSRNQAGAWTGSSRVGGPLRGNPAVVSVTSRLGRGRTALVRDGFGGLAKTVQTDIGQPFSGFAPVGGLIG
jgi:hypothetical protein